MQVKAMVELIAKAKGVMKGDNKVSDNWYRCFLERQLQLPLRKGDPTAAERVACTSVEILENYLELLKQSLKESTVMDKPAQLYDMDETGMPPENRAPNMEKEKYAIGVWQ